MWNYCIGLFLARGLLRFDPVRLLGPQKMRYLAGAPYHGAPYETLRYEYNDENVKAVQHLNDSCACLQHPARMEGKCSRRDKCICRGDTTIVMQVETSSQTSSFTHTFHSTQSYGLVA